MCSALILVSMQDFGKAGCAEEGGSDLSSQPVHNMTYDAIVLVLLLVLYSILFL